MAKSQPLVSKDGVSIDTFATYKAAKAQVERDEDGVPIHACGAISHRDCPCWTCASKSCAACMAILY